MAGAQNLSVDSDFSLSFSTFFPMQSAKALWQQDTASLICTLYNTCPLFATSSLQLSWCTCSIWWSNYYLPGYSSEFWGLFLFMPLKTVNHLSSNSWMCSDFFSLHSIMCQHHQLPLHQYQLLARWMFSHQPLFQTLPQWDPQKPALLHWTQLKNRLIWIRYVSSILLNNHLSSD